MEADLQARLVARFLRGVRTAARKDLKTTSKVVTVNSYWRCCGCGAIWNVGRLEAGTRNAQRWRNRR